jgi:hypothetical protein
MRQAPPIRCHDQEHLLQARRVLRLRRGPGGEVVAVIGSRDQPQFAVAQPVQLRARRKHLVEARDVVVVHQREIALDCCEQGRGDGLVGHGNSSL